MPSAFIKSAISSALPAGWPSRATLITAGKQVFLDFKLHDIGNTVQKGVESVAKLGATFLTVHAFPQTMKAAVEGRQGSALRILGVTVLTSYDDTDLAAAGYDMTVSELAAARAEQARDIGLDGLVCSAEEAAGLRGVVGHRMSLVTPGNSAVRQRRGRPKARHDSRPRHRSRAPIILSSGGPIVGAPDPKAAAEAIVDEIARTSTGAGMAKGYWIAQVEVKNDGYKQYVGMLQDIFKKHNARYVVRGGTMNVVEGQSA